MSLKDHKVNTCHGMQGSNKKPSPPYNLHQTIIINIKHHHQITKGHSSSKAKIIGDVIKYMQAKKDEDQSNS